MFEDAHKRKFDCVLFWALDRFTREGPQAIHRTVRTVVSNDFNDLAETSGKKPTRDTISYVCTARLCMPCNVSINASFASIAS
jgi:hypothetical protein